MTGRAITIRITWKRAILALVALVVLVLGVGRSGIINLAANVPHSAPVEWFIHWAYQNSVRAQATKVAAPATDPNGLVSAAGHFATSCAICHGAPGVEPSPVMQAAAVHAPDLSVAATHWENRELFWLLKHGVKYTSMPAWPVQDREDEVRRMAAFVRRLPGMTPAQYRALAYGPGGPIIGGEAVTLGQALPDCMRCHGTNGLGRGQPDIPVLAGQSRSAIVAALGNFATGDWPSGVMQTAAARTDPSTWNALADAFAGMPGGVVHIPRRSPNAARTAVDRRAARIVTRGLPSAGLPACASCHAEGKLASYPIMGRQKPEYLAGRLRRWQAGGDLVEARQPSAAMPTIARRIPADMIEPLARYYAAGQ